MADREIRWSRLTLAVGLVLLVGVSPLRAWLEGTLTRHLLLQFPLLVCAGVLLATAVPEGWRSTWARMDRYGLLGFLIALFTLLYWLLPRNLDWSLVADPIGASKIATLVLLCGFPLGLSGRLLAVPVRGLIWAQFNAMLLVMGWLYHAAPVRLCNSYLVDDQLLLGKLLLIIASGSLLLAVVLALSGGMRRFVAPQG